MSKIERYAGNLRAFGSNAQGLERTLFGETTQADDLTSQVTAAFLRGWGIVGPSENPSLEDFNAAMYALSQFIAYQHQMGIPEWDAAQEYYTGSLCVCGGETYSSLADDNIGSAPPSAKWTPVLTSKNGLTNLGFSTLTTTSYPSRISLLGWKIMFGIAVASSTPGAAKAITFPEAFKAEAPVLILSPNNASTAATVAWYDSQTKTGFNLRCNAVVSCTWIAIG